MARPLRIEYEGAHYHVTSRGNERKPVFQRPDREKFLELTWRAVEQEEAELYLFQLTGMREPLQ